MPQAAKWPQTWPMPKLAIAPALMLTWHAVVWLGAPQSMALQSVYAPVPSLLVAILLELSLPQSKRLRLAAMSVLLSIYSILLAYHAHQGRALDFGLLHDGLAEMPQAESLALLFDRDNLLFWMGIAATPLLYLWLDARLTAPALVTWRAKSLIAAGFLWILAFSPAAQTGPLLRFCHSARAFYGLQLQVDAEHLRKIAINAAAPYPLIHTQRAAAKPAKSAKPAKPAHVFVIALESFNANYSFTRSADGREYTPFFNHLAAQGWRSDTFWGNSVQTVRGHTAILCSLLPSLSGKILVDYPQLRLRCLPELLRDNGYRTLFATGQDNLWFENTGNAMKKIGFDVVQAMDAPLTADLPRWQKWGWGWQDDALYRKTFDLIDIAQHTDDKPLFVMLAPISNHMLFHSLPYDQRYFYPLGESPRELYANSVHTADRYLQVFFEELLKRPQLHDCIVVLVGDHSFPVGEHGNFHNELLSFEENFRTPLVIWSPLHLQPRDLHGVTASQVDLAPTILDLLGISAQVPWIGQSLLADIPLQQRMAIAVQPYDGRHLAVLRWPHKLVRQLAAAQEQLYDLQQDPLEQHDLAKDPQHAPLLQQLRADLALLALQQQLLEQNRLWPPAQKDLK